MADNSTRDGEDRDEPPDRADPSEADRGKTGKSSEKWVQLTCDVIVAGTSLWNLFHGNGG